MAAAQQPPQQQPPVATSGDSKAQQPPPIGPRPAGPSAAAATPAPPPAPIVALNPERDKQGRLTREGIKQVLAAGGSVLMNTTTGQQHITHAAHIPGDVELTRDDPDARKRAIADKRAERERLNAEIEQLNAADADEKKAAK